MMRKVALYFLFLTIASAAVFIFVFTFGRRPSLEQELARRTAFRGRETGEERSLTITSLDSGGDEEPADPGELPPPPETTVLSDTFTLVRSAVAPSGLVLLLDEETFSPGDVLERFFTRMQPDLELGLRSLAGADEGDCGTTVPILPVGGHQAGDLRAALGAVRTGGPRNLGLALEDAAADLAGIAGERMIIVLAAGDEGCGGAPCQVAAALQEGESPVRISTVALRPPEEYDPFAYESPPPVWQGRLECLADRGRGALHEASTPEELTEVLLRIAAALNPNVTIRASHAADREITGADSENREAWGVEIHPVGAESGGVKGNAFPASFSLPVGQYDLRLWYRGQERRLRRMTVTAGRHLDVEVNFRSGELYVEAKGAAGSELVGDTADFDCFWGVEVFGSDDLSRDFGSSCAFPAYFALDPGNYTIRTWKGEEEIWHEGIRVVEGETAVRSAVFQDEE